MRYLGDMTVDQGSAWTQRTSDSAHKVNAKQSWFGYSPQFEEFA